MAQSSASVLASYRGEDNKVVAATAQAARAAAPPPVRQPHPQRTSVVVHRIPSEVLHQSGITKVNGTKGPLTATEAHLFDAVVRELSTSDGGV